MAVEAEPPWTQHKLERLCQVAEILQAELDAERHRCRDANELCDRLRQELADISSRAVATNEMRRAEAIAIDAETSAELQRLASAQHVSEQRIAELAAEVRVERSRNEHLADQLAAERSATARLQGALAAAEPLRGELAASERRAQDAERQLAAAQRLQERAAEERAQSCEELAAARAEAERLRRREAELCTERDAAQRQCEEAQQRAEQLAAEQATVRAHADSAASTAREGAAAVRAEVRAVAELQQQAVLELRAENSVLRGENSALSARVAKQDLRLKEAQLTFAAAAESERQALRDREATREARIRVLESEVQSVESELAVERSWRRQLSAERPPSTPRRGEQRPTAEQELRRAAEQAVLRLEAQNGVLQAELDATKAKLHAALLSNQPAAPPQSEQDDAQLRSPRRTPPRGMPCGGAAPVAEAAAAGAGWEVYQSDLKISHEAARRAQEDACAARAELVRVSTELQDTRQAAAETERALQRALRDLEVQNEAAQHFAEERRVADVESAAAREALRLCEDAVRESAAVAEQQRATCDRAGREAALLRRRLMDAADDSLHLRQELDNVRQERDDALAELAGVRRGMCRAPVSSRAISPHPEG
eukprot:TRINITY_DN19846_c0_g1_i1.p1 TRINITY_DN19846_c0_g1~~TRINITY_DN19846_c0_g1_i1.p1  ORF type:complete len:604 (+),score=107.95 TRINITY_DN19846_c0_g1_i1:92-1903(+)